MGVESKSIGLVARQESEIEHEINPLKSRKLPQGAFESGSVLKLCVCVCFSTLKNSLNQKLRFAGSLIARPHRSSEMVAHDLPLQAACRSEPTIGALHLEMQRRELSRLLQELPASVVAKDPRFSALHSKLYPTGDESCASHEAWKEANCALSPAPEVPTLALGRGLIPPSHSRAIPFSHNWGARPHGDAAWSRAAHQNYYRDSRSRVLAAAEAKVADARAKLEAQRIVSRANQLCSRTFVAELRNPSPLRQPAGERKMFSTLPAHRNRETAGAAGLAGTRSTIAKHVVASGVYGTAEDQRAYGTGAGKKQRALTPVEQAVQRALAARSTAEAEGSTSASSSSEGESASPGGDVAGAAASFTSAAPWKVTRSPTAKPLASHVASSVASSAASSAASESRNFIEAQPSGAARPSGQPQRSVHAKQLASKPALRLNTKKAAAGTGAGGAGGGGKDGLVSTLRSGPASSKPAQASSRRGPRPKSAPIDSNRAMPSYLADSRRAAGGASRNANGANRLERIRES